MHILGISAFVHDSSAAIVKNGELIANVEEERFNRKKHADCFPIQAIQYVLKEGDICLSDIQVIAYNWNPFLSFLAEIKKFLFFPNIYFKVLKYNKPPIDFKTIIAMLQLKKYLKRLTGDGFSGKIEWVQHHLAHAASTYYLSPFEESDILIMDGHGESCSTSIYTAKNQQIIRQWDLSYLNSLGILYSNFTRFLGFGEFQEGTTMALASYGKDTYQKIFKEMVRLLPNGKFSIQKQYLGWWAFTNGKLKDKIGLPRQQDASLEQSHMDIAASLQKRIEETVLHVIRNTASKNQSKNLCMAGGLFLNCNINKRVQDSGAYKAYFIPPFPSDTGGAAGAALHAAYGKPRETFHKRPSSFSPYTGPDYSDRDIERALIKNGLAYTYEETPWVPAAQALAQGKVIGWFQGRLEAGPRALGNRSILANPMYENIQNHLNTNIKLREYFRPFAPVVTEKAAIAYFDIPNPIPETSSYMLLNTMVKNEFRKKLHGITHVDGSSRIQVIRPEWNRELYALLRVFEKLTGIGVIINTSFNKQEPIVCSPEDSIKTFKAAGMDMLVIGSYLVKSRISLN